MVTSLIDLAVIPVLIGPLQVLLAILPGLLVALFGIVVSLFRPRTLLLLLRTAWRVKGTLLAVVLAVLVVRWGVRRVWPAHAGGQGGAAVVGADWPVFRGNAARTGVAASTNAAPASEPARGGILWRHAPENAAFYASPAVSGNRLYVSSVEGISPFDRVGRGVLYGLDADSGGVVFAFSPTFASGSKRYRATFSSPVVSGRYLVCGEGLHETPNCRVVCVDIADEAQPRLAWSYETDNHLECSPVVGEVESPTGGVREARVYIGNGDTGGYHCLALAGGERRWHLPGDRFPDAETALVLHGNRLYAGLGNGGRALCVIDAWDGREVNRIAMPYPVFSPPAVADGRLYVGMGNGDFVHGAADLGLQPAGEVWAFDLVQLETPGCAPVWKAALDETVLGAVAADGGSVFCATSAGSVYRLDAATGAVAAHWNAGAPVKTSPSVAATHVYIVTETGMLYGLDRATLKPGWEARVSAGRQNIGSPVVARGHVYVGTDVNGLVCAGEPGEPETPLWAGAGGGPGAGGNPAGETLAARGELRWNAPASLAGEGEAAPVTAPVAVSGGSVIVPVAEAAGEWPAGLVCLRPGARGAEAGAPAWTVAVTGGVVRSPGVLGERVFAAGGRRGESGRALLAVEAPSGRVDWRHPVGADADGAFAVTRGGVLIADEPRMLSRVSVDGQRVWSAALPGEPAGDPAASATLAVVLTTDRRLVAFDLETGAGPLLDAPLAEAPTTGPILAGARVVFGTAQGVDACDLVSGGRPAGWGMSGRAVTAALTRVGDRVCYVTPEGELAVCDAGRDGATVIVARELAPGTAPLASGESLVCFSRTYALRLCPLSGEGPVAAPTPVWIEDTSSLGGKPVTPLVAAGGALYVGWRGWGLVCLGGRM